MSDLSNTQAPLPLHTVPPELLQLLLCKFLQNMPQVIKRVLPSITNETITLVKDTSLAFTISIAEMFTVAKQIGAAQTSVMPLLAAGIFYYVFNLIVATVMEYIEKRLSYYR